MESEDVRWKQRFQNFEKAFVFLKEAVEKDSLSQLEKAGLIQIYEFTFELAWKTLKDYLQLKGFEINFPRDTIKVSFQCNMISNGDLWMDMLEKRNLMSHTYDETKAELACQLIKNQYFALISALYDKLNDEL
jgi:nucleotidyltransferase substrate binding protein (TIGR01987 family)